MDAPVHRSHVVGAGRPRESVPGVLHVLSCDNWGGTEVQVATLVTASDPGLCRQSIAVLEPPSVLSRHVRALGLRVSSLHGAGGLAGAAIRLARVLRRERIDVVEAYGLRAGLVVRAAALAGGRPRVVIAIRGPHFVESPLGHPKTRIAFAIERSLAKRTTAYAANSEAARRLLISRGFPASKLFVFRNAVLVGEGNTREGAATNESPVLICVARFTRVKRHEVLLEALSILAAQGLVFRCELVGYGPTIERSRELSFRLGISEMVDFSGRISPDAVRERLLRADVFVLPSAWEGMPGSALEAMAVGLPVVATDVSGTNEVVIPGETGLLVPPDNPEALAAALSTLIKDGGLRRTFGAASRQRVAAVFSVERLVRERTAFYLDLASGRA